MDFWSTIANRNDDEQFKNKTQVTQIQNREWNPTQFGLQTEMQTTETQL